MDIVAILGFVIGQLIVISVICSSNRNRLKEVLKELKKVKEEE